MEWDGFVVDWVCRVESRERERESGAGYRERMNE